MNKRVLLTFFVVASCLLLHGQSYTFEDDYSGWSAMQGTLSITSDHYKQGTHSLCWSTQGKSVLLIKDFASFTANSATSCFMQIYLPEATMDTLVVEFLNGTSAKKTAHMLCNYHGWREFSRAYNEYASTSSATITAVRLTLYPADKTAERTLFFDDVNLSKAVDAGRVPGTQWVLDQAYMKVNTTPLTLFANPVDLPLVAPTAQELSDLEEIRTRLMPDPGYNAPQAIVAKNWVLNNISVVRNDDGTLLKGTILNTSPSGLCDDSLIAIGQRLQYLAGAKLKGNAACAQAFEDYLDLLLDQGLAAGGNIVFASNSYSAPRNIIPYFVSILPACTAREREDVCRLIEWMSFYYMAYYPESIYLANNVSDVLYLFLMHMLTAAAFHPEDEVAVRELRAMQRFLDRNAEYVPGGLDMLKPDGTGFHHFSHYNNYMYAYQTYMKGIYQLRNTVFEVSEGTYDRFGKAIMSIYTMASPGTGDKRYYANSLCGRNPFSSGNNIFFTKSEFQMLIDCGDSYPDLQDYYKAAYNYFFQTNTYQVDAVSFEGCHQFNYSPIGVTRHANWVATMRAPTSKFWGAELYSKENRFGRYQSHGSLEVMYTGNTLASSGYPTNGTGGGWDWNVIPGTTTVHYTSWAEMMPKQSQTQRFDQYSNGTNFAGALAYGAYGVFAANLSQSDKYGSNSVFTSTGLTAHKSVFSFDSILVALGSDICSSGSYADDMITATNLFQSIISPYVGNLVVNGAVVNAAYDEQLPHNQSNWLVAPTGTGYYLPASNDNVRVIYGEQTTPVETSADYQSPTTTATAAKAYVDHGVKCSNRSYEFAVVPATDANNMAQMAQRMQNGNVYVVRQQDSQVHAVQSGNVMAYSFFAETSGINYGIVEATTHQHLLIDQTDSETGFRHLALCNPNLEPKADDTYRWIATPTQTTITLKGEWKALEEVEGVVFSAPANGRTSVTVTFSEGAPVYVTIVPYDTPLSVGTIGTDAQVQILCRGDFLQVDWDEYSDVHTISVYSVGGQLLLSQPVNSASRMALIPISFLSQGAYICQAGSMTRKFFK